MRSFAERYKSDFSLLSANRFKGKFFTSLQFGQTINRTLGDYPNRNTLSDSDVILFEPKEIHRRGKFDITSAQNIPFVPEGGFKIEGNFECEKLIEGIKSELLTELKCVSNESLLLDNTCIINLRGGEFSKHKDLALQISYFENAILRMGEILGFRPEFKVVTDDLDLAKKIFPDFQILSDSACFDHGYEYPVRKVEKDFSLLQNARYLILSNSSFSWWGAWTNTSAEVVIAPKYWARHSTGYSMWSPGGILTKDWHYIDRAGKLFSSLECEAELRSFSYNFKRLLNTKSNKTWWEN